MFVAFVLIEKIEGIAGRGWERENQSESIRYVMSFSFSKDERQTTMGEKSEKVCIITGSSSGLGWVAAKKLVAKNYHTIFACRDEEKTLSLLEKLKEESGRSNFEFVSLDLSSFASIRRFVEEFHRRGLPLHLLINNAGLFAKTFQKSADGIELTFAVNHLGHCSSKRRSKVPSPIDSSPFSSADQPSVG